MTTRGNFSQLLARGLTSVMFEWMKQFPEEYSQFLDVGSSDSAYDDDQMIAGLGTARLKLEGEGVTYDDPIQGPTRRYINEVFALAWQITHEMKRDDKYGIMKKLPGELMKSCRQTWETLGANVLNLAFSTMLSADGVSFMNSAHPMLGGGTYSNILSPAQTLSQTAVQDIIMLYENMVNERGLKMMLSPDDLWIAPENQFTAGEIFQSTLKPYTGNNEINVIRGRLQPNVLHFMTSTTRWFVSSREHNEAKLLWREKPVMESSDDFETRGTKHAIFFSVATGVTDWRGWAGSNS